jgi:hypothetical protein
LEVELVFGGWQSFELMAAVATITFIRSLLGHISEVTDLFRLQEGIRHEGRFELLYEKLPQTKAL